MKKTTQLVSVASFFLLGLSSLVVYGADFNVTSSTEPYHITADYLEFQELQDLVIARGNVRITQTDLVLTADEVIIHTDTQRATLRGHADIRSPDAHLQGEYLEYDMKARRGFAEQNVVFESPPYHIVASKALKIGDRTYRLKSASFTTCRLKEPHYHLRARSATLVQGKEFRATNVLVYLGHVPLFYWPFYRKDLDTLYSFEADPGYSESQGYSLRTTHGYPFGPYVYGKAFVDYLSRRGWGTGGEVDYNRSERYRGTIYGYHIKERVTFRERWNMRADHWQRLTPKLSTQASARFQSDSNFNNEFLKSAYDRINSNLDTSAAVVYQNRLLTSRVLYQYNQVFDSTSSAYVTDLRKAPEAQLTTTAMKIPGLNLVTTAFANFGSVYTAAEPFTKPTAQTGFAVSRELRLSRRMTLKPQAGFSESWSGRRTAEDPRDDFVARYNTSLNVRRRFPRYVTIDLTHDYSRRLQANGWRDDSEAVDKGIETNRLGLIGHWRPNRVMILRILEGYDISRDRGEVVEDFRQKLEPLAAELTFNKGGLLYLFFRTDYKLYEHEVNSVLSDAEISLPKAVTLKVGASYEGALPQQFLIKNGLALPLGSHWRAEMLLRYQAQRTGGLDIHKLNFTEKEINIRRLFHDFVGRFRYLERAGERQVYIRIDFQKDVLRRDQLRKSEVENEFYPWRENQPTTDR